MKLKKIGFAETMRRVRESKINGNGKKEGGGFFIYFFEEIEKYLNICNMQV